jgi:hypothetical protein
MRHIAIFYSRLRKEYGDRLSDINRISGTDVAAGEAYPRLQPQLLRLAAAAL